MKTQIFFDVKNSYAPQMIACSLRQNIKANEVPIIACIGSDITIGDSLGPLVGTLLEKEKIPDLFIYGTLKNPITAKEVISLCNHIRYLHPYKPILAIDAAVGAENEVGLIKFQNDGLYPGIGVGKKLQKMGDYSLMGIVAKRSKTPYRELQSTRLSMIYRQATAITGGILDFLSNTRFDLSSFYAHTV